MTDQTHFFTCKACGNFIGIIHSSRVPMVCCGKPMEKAVSNLDDASSKRHMLHVIRNKSSVSVSIEETPQPMKAEHCISWVYLQTNRGGQRKCLFPDEKPKVTFYLSENEIPVAVYVYCNLHNLWKKNL